jgi:hypothetical protein
MNGVWLWWSGRTGVIDRRWPEESTSRRVEIVTSVTRRGGDTVNAGRILMRALVVFGGAVADSTIAWLTATASASTITQVTDGPIGAGTPAVATPTGDPQPHVLSQVTGSVPVVRHAARRSDARPCPCARPVWRSRAHGPAGRCARNKRALRGERGPRRCRRGRAHWRGGDRPDRTGRTGRWPTQPRRRLARRSPCRVAGRPHAHTGEQLL